MKLTPDQAYAIEQILEKHQPAEYSWGVDGCTCDADVKFGEQAAHQLAHIVAALATDSVTGP